MSTDLPFPTDIEPTTLGQAKNIISGLRADLEEERAAYEKAKNNERCFRELAEHIREVFWMTNPLGDELVYISPAYEQIWGQTCESLYEDPGRRLAWVYATDRQRVLKAFKRDARSGDFDEIYRIDRPDGEIRWIRDRAFPVLDEAGNVYRLAGFALDITDGIEDSDRINELHSSIGLRDRVSVFAAMGTGLAHDMSQPLTAAQTFIAHARQNISSIDEEADSSLGRASEEITRAVNMIRHMRDFARDGRPALESESLRSIVDEVHELMDPPLRANGIRYSGPSPEVLEDLHIPVDRVFTQQILRNLIGNSIDAFDEPAEEAYSDRHLELHVRPGADYVEIEVADNGRGIGDAVNPFEPFGTTKTQGLGLGLAVSRSLARSHKGDLILFSRGRGSDDQARDDRTRFVLRLPRKTDVDAPAGGSSPGA